MTHDYKRNGTTTLFAALELAEGKLIGTCMQRHRHQEWIKFLKLIDQQTPADLDLHLIADNYSTHKHPKVQAVAQAASAVSHALHPDQQFVAEPGGTLVPRDHRQANPPRHLPQRRGLDRGHHGLHRRSITRIQKSFVWTAKAEDILAKVARAWDTLNVASE